MQCHQARKRLDASNWRSEEYSQDVELVDHLNSCLSCSSLVRAEEALEADLEVLRLSQVSTELSIAALRERVEAVGQKTSAESASRRSAPRRLLAALVPNSKPRIAVALILAVCGIIALVPLDIKQKVGYQIAIDGVERNIAMDNPKITSLLGALGMEQAQATNLLDSLGMNQIHFTVGECSETCRLTIFDLRTERDVQLMVRAIIDLGCCRIDNIAPVFRNESMSLLGLATRKLLS